METTASDLHREPWNKGKVVGQKAPFKLRDIWALRVRLQMLGRVRELALFNLGIDSKLRGCDLVKLRVQDICHGEQVAARAIVMQQKNYDRCSSRSQRPPAKPFTPESNRPGSSLMTTCSRAEFKVRRTSAPASTHAFSKTGWKNSDSIQRAIAPIRCAAPRSR